MPQSNYQEPIEKEDLDLQKKFGGESSVPAPEAKEKKEEKPVAAPEVEIAEKMPSVEEEAGKEVGEKKISEKIETARKTIGTQKPAVAANVASDAQAVSQIVEYEKKVEKLVQIALEKGPIHAIKVAQHLDRSDDYTLDELHDRMIENDLRKQLFQKGLLKEL